jgi:hypothetical protein
MSDSASPSAYNFTKGEASGYHRRNLAKAGKKNREGYEPVALSTLEARVPDGVKVSAWRYKVRDASTRKAGMFRYKMCFDVAYNGKTSTVYGISNLQTLLVAMAIENNLNLPAIPTAAMASTTSPPRSLPFKTRGVNVALQAREHSLLLPAEAGGKTVSAPIPSLPSVSLPAPLASNPTMPQQPSLMSTNAMFRRPFGSETGRFIGGLSMFSQIEPILPCPRCNGEIIMLLNTGYDIVHSFCAFQWHQHLSLFTWDKKLLDLAVQPQDCTSVPAVAGQIECHRTLTGMVLRLERQHRLQL